MTGWSVAMDGGYVRDLRWNRMGRQEPAMVFAKPHFLLFCDASVSRTAASDTDPVGGRWHFVLERIDAAERLEAADGERAQARDRLSLLAVVRGLEALQQPSQVTLVTTSRYVARGLRYGLGEWRESGYIWEHFGVQKPIRNADLWQRIDGAMRYHEVACRLLESSLAAVASNASMEVPGDLEEVGASLDNQLPDTGPLIPAPHFQTARKGRLAVRLGNAPTPHSGFAPADDSSDCEPVDQRSAPGGWHVEPNLDSDTDVDAASEAWRARRAASVRSVPRSHLQQRPSSWWQLASGWLGWWQGRAWSGRGRLSAGLGGSLSS